MEQKTTLRELREQSGKTRAEVANALGVSIAALSHYELGIRRIDIVQVLILSKLYDTGADEIIEAQLSSISIRKTN